MVRSLLILLPLSLCLVACGPKAQLEDSSAQESAAAPAAEAPASEAAVAEAAAPEAPARPEGPKVGPPPPMATAGVGVCRGYGAPEDFDAKGLSIRGAFPGELGGTALSEPQDYASALRACVDNPECSGITSSWYLDFPFVAMKAEGAFRPDDNSYGCTTLVEGRP